jgi:hypothetical protein
MLIKVLILVTLTDRDDSSIVSALNQIASQELRHTCNWRTPDLTL